MSEASRKSAPKTRGRPFRPGNPGKPKGTRHKVTRAIEELLDGEADKLTRKCVELALEGDVTALRLCMDRIAPPRKDRPVNIALPAVREAKDVPIALTVVIEAVGSGDLTPSEGQALAGLIESQRKSIELVEFERRLAELEGVQQ